MASWSALKPEEIQVVVKESFERFKRQREVKRDAMLQLEEDIKKKQSQARKRERAPQKPTEADAASSSASECQGQVAELKSPNKKRRNEKEQDTQSAKICVKKEQDSQSAMALVAVDECQTMVAKSTTRSGGRLGGRHAKGSRPKAYQKRIFSSNSHVSQHFAFTCVHPHQFSSVQGKSTQASGSTRT